MRLLKIPFNFIIWLYKLIRSRLSYKLFFVYIIVITLPVAAFSFISYKTTSKVIENDFVNYKQNSNKKIITSLENKIDILFNQSLSSYFILDDIQSILREPAYQVNDTYLQTFSRINSYSLSSIFGNKNINGITLIDMDGTIKFHMDKQMLPFKSDSFKNLSWFKKTLELDGMPYIQEPHYPEYITFVNNFTPIEDISLSRLIKAWDNKTPLGIAVFEMTCDNLWSDFKDYDTEPSEVLAVLSKTGKIIYSKGPKNSLLSDAILNEINLSKNGTFKIKGRKGEVLINSIKSSLTDWKLVSIMPMSALYEKSKFIKNINNSLLILISIFILILSLVISNLIAVSLKKLVKSFSKVKEGDFNTFVSIKGTDELAQIGLAFNEMVLGINNLIKERYQSNILKKQAQLEALESQINPHFLYNTLAMMKDMIYNGDTKKSMEMIQNLSDIFRYCLGRGKHIVKLSDELEQVQKYLSILSERFKGKFNVFYDIDPDVLNFNIPRLTIQPIVENSINHGFENIKAGGEIHITVKKTDESYKIYIFDNGKGIPEEKLRNINQMLEESPLLEKDIFERIGFFNVNTRIKFYFGNEYGLRIDVNPNKGTIVKITLPLTSEGSK